jgi:glycosyltransferase involved in cell wall biosynthesis
MSVNVLAVLVGAAARTGGPPAFVGDSALEIKRVGGSMVVLSTDLALAPTGYLQAQRRVTRGELHVSLEQTDTRVYPARFPRRLAFSPGLYRAACELAPRHDVVHLHNLWQFPQYAGYRAARQAGVPYVVSPHGALDPFLRRHGRLRKRVSMLLYQERLLQEATLIHVTTQAEAELITDIAADVPRAVVPCGIHVDDFKTLPDADLFRNEHLGGYDGPLALFLGRVTYKKGVDVLLRAFAQARQYVEARLAIVGPDDEGLTPGLKALARSLGIGEDVSFVGPLYGGGRLAALAATDVWTLASHTENFGIAVIEAMAAGCPVVVTSAVNVAGDIAAAQAGVVTDVAVTPFGEALAELLADGSRRAELRDAGRAFAARYDWSVVTPALVDMYERAAAT